MKLLCKACFFLLVLSSLPFAAVKGQERVTSVGLSYRPIFPVAFLGTGPETQADSGVSVTTALNSGFSGGMLIRRGFSDLLAGEIGLNYVKRKYNLTLEDSAYSNATDFSLIGYEIPLNLMVFIQLGEHLFMNASMGLGLDAFASSIRTTTPEYEQIAAKRYVVLPALNANLGWDYRTSSSGIIYVGTTYHRPFQDIYSAYVNYRNNGKDLVFNGQLSGSYLTIDLRYYFHEDPDRIHKKK